MPGDMGAEVIKVEPIDGNRARRLLGAGKLVKKAGIELQ